MSDDGARAMPRLGELRIVRWPGKLAYAVVAWGVILALGRILGLTDVPTQAVDILTAALEVIAIYAGTRMFRSRREPIRPPRPRWKLTARPTASRWLGVVFAVAFGIDVAYLVLVVVDAAAGYHVRPAEEPVFAYLVALVQFFVLAIAFQNSAIRMGGRGLFPARRADRS